VILTAVKRWRFVVVIAALALVAAACGDDVGTTTTTQATGETTTTTTEAPPPGGYATECPDDPYAGADANPTYEVVAREIEEGAGPEFEDLPGTSLGTYSTGIFTANTTVNYWAYLDTLSTVWNAYVLAGTKPSLYGTNFPGFELDYDLAAEAALVEVDADGDPLSVTVPMRTDAVWSDGTPITAHDIVFTAETVRDLELGGNWLSAYAWAGDDPSILGLTNVEAIDDNTVKFTWNMSPGLAVWPYGPGVSPVMPQHVWGDIVDAAAATEDPRAELYANDASTDVSGGTKIFGQREEGAFTLMNANPNYYDSGRVIESAGGSYTVGPFFDQMVFTQYGDQSAAVLALRAGEVDFLFNPLGMQRGLMDQVIADPNLTSIVNNTNGFRYMGFNLREAPMCWQGFRDATAFMIDKEFMANSVLQGVAFPLYAAVPEGNTSWYNEEIASEFAASVANFELETRHDGEPFVTLVGRVDDDGEPVLDDDGEQIFDEEPRVATGAEARLHAAVAALKADGFTWEGNEPDFENAAIVPGSGVMHGGLPVKPLEIIAPGPGYDPLRSTYAVWITGWLSDLGFNVRAFNTDFNTLVDAVFVPIDGVLEYDMFLLGWSLGDPALPTFHESFWAGKNDTLVNDGNNNTGFNHPGFNNLVEAFNAATSLDEAYAIMWEMERILFEYKPYILLFDTGIIEFYRSSTVAYPFTETLSGLQFIGGAQSIVQGR
jgi:peptide/nickel transport system substrate-binding protein